MILGNFHFLRPLWFLALLPVGLLFWRLWALRLRAGQWSQAISSRLLPHLLEARHGARLRWPLLLLLAAWLLAIFSLAGPVWRKLPQPVRQKQDVLVIIQDLSLSFYAQDLAPNRLTRARHKLVDLLKARKEGMTALIVYAGDAHLVCPLTDDTGTIAAMVPDLEPGIMPGYGSNLKAAVELAMKLMVDTSVSRGRILLLTDEVNPDDAAAVSAILRGRDVSLSVLGVGTAAGGPIPKGDGGFLQDEQGNIVIPRLVSADLRRLAADNGGRYSEISLDDADFNYLLNDAATIPGKDEYRQVDREFDQWREEGYRLLVPILVLALLGFRRGWLILALVLAVLLPPRPGAAMEWRDLWLRKDQQAAQALAENRVSEAAGLFQDPQWRGAAAYRAGDFSGALDGFAKSESGDGYYNRGNALARLGRLEEAVQAYEQALKINPGSADALANKQLVEELLRQQRQENPKDNQEKSGQGQNKAGQSQPDKSGQGRNQPGQDSQENSGSGPGQKQGQPAQSGQSGQMSGQSQPDQQKNSGRSGPGQQNNGSKTGRGLPQEGGRDGDSWKTVEGKAAELNKTGRQSVAAGVTETDRLTPEQQQRQEQMLALVPDNPGGLLRRKFQYQYQNNRQRGSGNNRKIW